MRGQVLVAVIGVVGLVSCAPTVPDSAAGVGEDAVTQRDRLLAQGPAQSSLPEAAPVEASALAPAPQAQAPSSSTAAATPAQQPLPDSVQRAVDDTAAARAAARQEALANSGEAPVQASPSNPPPVQVSNPGGISSEQDFDTVSARRSIESDAQRIAANRAQYQVITPTTLPTRPGTNQPNIVQYALRTNNPVGTQIYRRSNLRSGRHQAACAEFPSADQAQIAFLSEGGPQRDRRSLDPDGDGYACGWDPTPFRGIARRAPSSVVEPLAISTE